ncbi:ferritin [Citrobacter koseri]|uniref:Ferritin n=1 Tax=Citrobacter koseri TaxID=545 RepID=A0A2X2VRL5_CITKO|nr:ferritin [Citrobacter koseri]
MSLNSMKKRSYLNLLLIKLTLAGKSGEGLYFIDKELSTLDTQN